MWTPDNYGQSLNVDNLPITKLATSAKVDYCGQNRPFFVCSHYGLDCNLVLSELLITFNVPRCHSSAFLGGSQDPFSCWHLLKPSEQLVRKPVNKFRALFLTTLKQTTLLTYSWFWDYTILKITTKRGVNHYPNRGTCRFLWSGISLRLLMIS